MNYVIKYSNLQSTDSIAAERTPLVEAQPVVNSQQDKSKWTNVYDIM
jgi:hypothetical protein